ncbi:MAG: ribosomal protein [Bacteroidetes bacterium]|nr:ribosomal protein [Bacteroidota bacterium]
MRNFKELKVWQKARVLVKEVYLVSAKFPSEERYGITQQFRNATISISNNIAEGCGRRTDADFKRFIDISCGSATETENMTYLALDLNFIKTEEHQKLISAIEEIQKMLIGLYNSLN